MEKLAKNDLLFQLVDKFTEIDLHPKKVPNHEMGQIYEELLRKFNEFIGETAGHHYTPRDIIKLVCSLLFEEHKDELKKHGVMRSLYDPACGTLGMLTVAKDYIHDEINPDVELLMYGQELNEQIYAVAKSDVLICGDDAGRIRQGSSFKNDKFKGNKFDFMLSNPPFGVSWKKEQDFIKNEANDPNGRFSVGLPSVDDGAMLFVQHMISKMNPKESRIGVILNRSPLITGDAGSGLSNIRKWIIESDWLEAIVALPTDIFYNTGIPTYIWILSNNKSAKRRGKIQLINAVDFYVTLRRGLGNKRREISDEQIKEITKLYTSFQDMDLSRIFDNAHFAFTKVRVEQPLIKNGKIVRDKKVNLKADKSKRDYERIPISEDTDEYMRKNVLPYSPNAWIDKDKNRVGYRILLDHLLYRYSSPQPVAEKMKYLDTAQKELEELVKEKEHLIKYQQKMEKVDIGWIDEIPSHWEVLPNRALFEERNERGGRDEELLSVTQDRGVIRQEDLGIKVDSSNTDKSKYKRVESGDLVYNKMRMWQGAIGYSCYKGIVSPAYIVLKPKPGVYSKFFYYLFKCPNYIQQSHKYSYGLCDDMNSLRYEDFRKMLSIVPPYDEQRAIANVLEKRSATLDSIVLKKNAIVEILQECATGAFSIV